MNKNILVSEVPGGGGGVHGGHIQPTDYISKPKPATRVLHRMSEILSSRYIANLHIVIRK